MVRLSSDTHWRTELNEGQEKESQTPTPSLYVNTNTKCHHLRGGITVFGPTTDLCCSLFGLSPDTHWRKEVDEGRSKGKPDPRPNLETLWPCLSSDAQESWMKDWQQKARSQLQFFFFLSFRCTLNRVKNTIWMEDGQKSPILTSTPCACVCLQVHVEPSEEQQLDGERTGQGSAGQFLSRPSTTEDMRWRPRASAESRIRYLRNWRHCWRQRSRNGSRS